MSRLQNILAGLAVASVALTSATPALAADRSMGQVIDDTVITTEVKAKLAADKLSNLTKIEVKTDHGVVTLNGTVDDADRATRALQITSAVNGVRGIVNNIHVAGTTVPAAPVATSAPTPGASVPGTYGAYVDATGIVASVDPASGTITLQDGRVLRVSPQSTVWQPSTLQSLRPGMPLMVRDATPVAVQPAAAAPAPDWRMGTVASIDRTSGTLVLTDGTVVRLAPSSVVRRGSERVALDQIVPGSEVVVRTRPMTYGTGAEGSALPGRIASAPTIDASEVSVVWAPVR